MDMLRINAHAKINLGLDVIGERADGYHELRMIMQSLALCDEVILQRTQAPVIRLKVDNPELPTDARNLAYRAAELLLREFPQQGGLMIDLKKHIPVAAGLAGGSTDGAAVLAGVNALYGLGLDEQVLRQRAVRLGADMPYCLMGGTALAEGIGEQLRVLPSPPPCSVVLAKPAVGISTKEVYQALDQAKDLPHPDIDGQIKALEEQDLEKLCALMGNVLETVTLPVCPAAGRLKEAMKSCGAMGTLMSGSGPTVFGLFAGETAARQAVAYLKQLEEASEVILTRWANRNTV